MVSSVIVRGLALSLGISFVVAGNLLAADKIAHDLTTIAADKPNIDLEINFEVNSAQISKSEMPTIEALAKALTDPAIKGSTFLVSVFTNEKGSARYNQKLSERRADAVKRILVQKYGIAADTLVTAGYGKTHLKNASNPYGAENRRIAIVNISKRPADFSR